MHHISHGHRLGFSNGHQLQDTLTKFLELRRMETKPKTHPAQSHLESDRNTKAQKVPGQTPGSPAPSAAAATRTLPGHRPPSFPPAGARPPPPPPASAAAYSPRAGIPWVQSVEHPGMAPPYDCPSPRKSRTPGLEKSRHPRRTQKPDLRPKDGADSRRIKLEPSERVTHRQGKMAEKGRGGRAHGVMGSGRAIARLSM